MISFAKTTWWRSISRHGVTGAPPWSVRVLAVGVAYEKNTAFPFTGITSRPTSGNSVAPPVSVVAR